MNLDRLSDWQRWYARHKDEPGFKEKQRAALKKSRDRRKNSPEFKSQKAKHDLNYRLKVRDSEEYRKKRNSFNIKQRKSANFLESVKKWKKENEEKVKAHQSVKYDIRVGKLISLHAHHKDYSLPLEVEWLCAFCHGNERRKYA